MTRFVNRSRPHTESGARHLDEAAENDPLFIRATARTMMVLSAFHETDRPMSLSEIARAAGLDRSTTQRIVHTLRQLGYLQRDPHDRGYVPGIRIYDHIFDAMRLNRQLQPAVPLLLDLRRNVNERVDLSLIDDTRLVYAFRLPPKREVLHAMMVGLSVPIYCTSAGWSVLSRMPEDEARDLIRRSDRQRYTAQTLIDEDAIMAEVEKAGETGYAVAVEQLLPGEIAIGAAVTNTLGRPVAAVTISGLSSDWTPEEFARAVSPSLMQTVAAIGRA
ncbi:IclR family transcriptional regulator [Pseudodonghicola flavimaris]|uniref:IclR family transcriptional regulator n=1 Tax=Pseudodonghicola flavimaris TaxID=3050036 RepID=A0ABT7F5K7_9RHOB|nr:IclR family transcriptional regulator [Pseudodonghicola flavimaris]MDK3019881.1 IclR family transcriptional regulator [Pseudodonghicola flavimaris]